MLAIKEKFQPPFRVLSARGYTLGKFEKCDEAMLALRSWSQAVAVIQGDRVIARKQGGHVHPGVKSALPRKRAS